MKPKILKGDIAVDDRGAISFVNEFEFKDVKRFYMVSNHKAGFVRAWHGHKKEAKYVLAVSGSVLIGVKPLDKDEPPIPYVLSEKKPEVLYIPPGYYNGFKTLTNDAKIMFFSTASLEESKDDDIRKPAKLWDIWSDLWR